MILAGTCNIIKKLLGIALCVALIFPIAGCRKEAAPSDPSVRNDAEQFQEADEVTALKLFFDNTQIPVIWEQNDTVEELFAETANGDIVVAMSMYGGNEQVGSLGRNYTRSDSQTTTHNGDIVLYSGDQIVVFYGSNSWSYTRLGKMDLPEDEVVELLSKGNITLTIRR